MYKYTNPDVIRFRRNLYRVTLLSTLLSWVYALGFLAVMHKMAEPKVSDPVETPITE